MLRGERVALRARFEDDVAVLHAELYEDVVTSSRADTRPWRPIPRGPDSPFAVPPDSERDAAVFSVVDLATGELAGEALLWRIDTHNRNAHVGLSMLPSFRGRGLGTDAVRVLCHYGFTVRGLARLQVDTLADNAAMQAAAVRAGFTPEGVIRRSAWVCGEFLDEVVLGLLAEEWREPATGR